MPLISTLLMVVVAEMGDKTQLLALAFAAKYRASRVLLGILIGSLLNHGMAVAVGTYLGDRIPLQWVGMGAALLFLLFGVMALRPEDEEEEEEPGRFSFGPVATVAAAFFLGEFGDKTQLTTLAMAVEHQAPVLVLIGAVGGMLVANSPGVLIGERLIRLIRPQTLKRGSAAVFVLFGLATLYEKLEGAPGYKLGIVAGAAALTGLAAWLAARQRAAVREKGASEEHAA